ncbi:MAG TPA: DUF4349 domain-containing protein [Polyangiaceae bacterium]
MRSERRHAVWLVILGIVCALLCACDKRERAAPSAAAGAAATEKAPVAAPEPPAPQLRRVIRTAEMSVETDAPEVAVSKVTALADAKGGFVVSSDTSRSKDADGAETVSTTLVFRVPVGAFDEALAAVRAMGSRVSSEKVTGEDVTEEYVDIEARIRAQRAVEEHYMAILKDAKTIPDILAVQQKLGDVRTEIERAEGRRRYLESQTSLSTITVHVARHIEAVDASGPGFGRSISLAGHDAMAVGVAIVNGAIRLVGVLLPVGLLVAVPLWLVVRTWRRRRSAWVPRG